MVYRETGILVFLSDWYTGGTGILAFGVTGIQVDWHTGILS